MNRWEGIGNLKAEPKRDGPVLRLQLVVNDVERGPDGTRVDATFVSVELHGTQAGVIDGANLRPGDELMVVGRLTQAQVGTERKTRVRAHDVRILNLVSRAAPQPDNEPPF